MENLYLVKDDSQLATFRDFVVRNTEKLKDYQSFLKNELAVCDLPQAVIWSSFNAATQIIRESAVPAYTNNRRMVMTPDLAVWKELYFLTEEEFQAEKICNQSLVELFQKKYGWHSLNDFGSSTYDKNYASIFYEYWRSFLTIDKLVENLGSVQAVFDSYHLWANTDKTLPLLNWFVQQKLIEKEI